MNTNNIAAEQQKNRKNVKIIMILKYAIIILNVIVACMPIVSYIYNNIFAMETLNRISLVSIFVVGLQILIIFLGKIHDSQVEYRILGSEKKSILEQLNPRTQNELEKAREEMRAGLTIIMIAIIVSLIVCYFFGFLNISVSIAIGLIMVIAYIYGDYLPHAKRYAREYDSLFCDDCKPNEFRGLARIYLDEFKCNNKLGKKLPDEWQLYNEDTDDKEITEEFIHSIISARSAMTDQTLEIIMWAMLVVSILTIRTDIYQVIVQQLLDKNVANFMLQTITLLAPIVFMTVSLCQLYECYAECELLKYLWKINQSDVFEERLEACKKIIMETRGELCKIRGRFIFTEKYIEKYKDVSRVPMKYRMIFSDRYVANKVRYFYTYVLTSVIIAIFMLNVNYICTWIWIAYFIVMLIGYIIGDCFVLPNINKRRVEHYCRVLCKQEKSKKMD